MAENVENAIKSQCVALKLPLLSLGFQQWERKLNIYTSRSSIFKQMPAIFQCVWPRCIDAHTTILNMGDSSSLSVVLRIYCDFSISFCFYSLCFPHRGNDIATVAAPQAKFITFFDYNMFTSVFAFIIFVVSMCVCALAFSKRVCVHTHTHRGTRGK